MWTTHAEHTLHSSYYCSDQEFTLLEGKTSGKPKTSGFSLLCSALVRGWWGIGLLAPNSNTFYPHVKERWILLPNFSNPSQTHQWTSGNGHNTQRSFKARVLNLLGKKSWFFKKSLDVSRKKMLDIVEFAEEWAPQPVVPLPWGSLSKPGRIVRTKVLADSTLRSSESRLLPTGWRSLLQWDP